MTTPEVSKRYREKHREKLRKYAREYRRKCRQENPEKIKEQKRAWYELHKDRICKDLCRQYKEKRDAGRKMLTEILARRKNEISSQV